MKKVTFFAVIREKTGKKEMFVDSSDCKVSDLIGTLRKDIPDIEHILTENRAMIAVNHEMADRNTPIKDGDEIAFIPPFSGGQEMIRIQSADFSMDDEVRKVKMVSGRIGGIAVFLGTGRDFSRGREIQELVFEHYEGMAEKKLSEIREKAIKDFGIIEMAIIHRIGNISTGDNIVLIIAASEHRKEAFEACHFAIDELKRITPIWKKERASTGEVWVEEHP